MRIADILFSYAVPGAFVVDLTAESAGLSTHAALAPELGLPYQRGLAGGREGTALALVLHSLPAAGEEAAEPLDLDGFSGLASGVAHIVFCDRVEAFLQHGLIDLATRTGHELSSTHVTEHRVFRFAAVLRRPDGETGSARLRLVSEYRLDKLLLSELERAQARSLREHDALRAKLAEVRASRDKLRDEVEQLRADYQRLRTEHKLLESDHQQTVRARDEARSEAAAEHQQAQAYESRLGATYQALQRSRRSLGFRLGLATWAAASPDKNILAMPRRWIRTFRGTDEVLEKLRTPPRVAGRKSRESRVEVAAVEKGVLLLGVEPAAGRRPGVAGVVGPRFAAELSASARFRALTPHAWRYLLEAEPPAYVLVTADGLQPGAPWAGWGTPGGRDGAAMLRELVTWCRGMHVPIVYWDTVGTGRPVPGLRFDALFSVSRRRAAGLDPAAELLLPGIEPHVWNPVAVEQTAPKNPIYVGAFDRRGDRAELAALEALLGAASGRGLEILDSHRGIQGQEASAVRFPAGLDSLARRRPPADAARLAIKRAGLLLCGNALSGSDFPSWDLLHGLGMGVHVVSTPADLEDGEIALAIELAGNAEKAADALDRLAQRPLLDATWRRGFDRLLTGYSLRDRLDEIARRCGVAAVAEPSPSVAVIARLGSDGEARELRAFLASQTVAPIEVRVVVDGEIDVDGQLGEVIDRARITSRPASDPQAWQGLSDTGATHLLCWSAGTPAVADAVAELLHAATVADADVVALAGGTDGTGTLYGYGELPADGVIAVQRAAIRDRLLEGVSPHDAAVALASAGTGCFVASRGTASGSGSQRSVA